MTPERRLQAAWAALAILVALAWSNALTSEFTYDDKVEVVGNTTIRVLEDWRAVLGYNVARPLLVLTYAISYRLGGMDPLPYHLADVLLHALNTGLVLRLGWLVGRRVGLSEPVAFGVLGAGLWALHPLGTESVTYVTGRSEQLCATFYVLSCVGWLRYREAEDRRTRWLAWGGTWLAFVAAALSKEVAATLPLALLLLDRAGTGSWREVRWWALSPGALLLALAGLFRLQLLGHLALPEADRTLAVQVLTQGEVFWRYVQLAFVPAGQSIFHDHPEAEVGAQSVGALAAWVCGVGGGLWALGRPAWRVQGLGWLWWCLLLLPSSSVVPLKETMAEHRTHLALLGLAWMVAGALAGRGRRWWTLGAVAAVLLGGLTWKRNAVWATEVELWGDAVAVNAESAEAWYGYGDSLRMAGRFADAELAYRESLRRDPALLDAWTNLGITLAQQNRDVEAMEAWEEALRRRPTYCRAHNNIGLLHARRGRATEALTELRTSLVWCPDDVNAWYWTAKLYDEQLDDPKEALAAYQKVVDLAPSHPFAPEARQRVLELTW